MKEGIGVLGGHVEPRQHALAAAVDVAHEIDLVALLGAVCLVDADWTTKSGSDWPCARRKRRAADSAGEMATWLVLPSSASMMILSLL